MTVSIAVVEDHDIVGIGVRELLKAQPDWQLVSVVRSVGQLELADLDLVLLDLRLDDGSSPGDNVAALHAAGVPAVAFTAGEDPALIRAAAKAGVVGIIRKSDRADLIVDVIASVLDGTVAATADWAAAIDGDSEIADAGLSKREREVLGLYASGETAASVAAITGLSRVTIAAYVSRIRTKYALAGRPAVTKVDLHLRAREDGILGSDPRPR